MSTAFDSLIKEAEEKKKLRELQKNNKGGNNNFQEYEQIEFVGVEQGKQTAFRITGLPYQRKESPYDCTLILQSKILKEGGKGYAKINWKWKEENGKFIPDPEWILTKLYNKVTEGKWEKLKEKKKNRAGKEIDVEYKCFHSNTSIFEKLKSEFGNSKAGEKFPKKFFPSVRVLMNIIDRQDTWCADNKHTKVLTNSKSVYDKKDEAGNPIQIIYTEDGIPASRDPFEIEGLYDQILSFYLSTSGDWRDTDCVLEKKGKLYEVYDALETRRLKTKLASSEPLTKEELAYEKYNFDELFPVASYQKLLKHLGYLFILCDKELKTNFHAELVLLAQKEKEENESKREDKEETTQKEEPKKVETKEESTPLQERAKANARVKKETPKEESIVDLCKNNFPKWDSLTEEDKQIVIGSIDKFEGTVPIWFEESNPLPCSENNCFYHGTKTATLFPEVVGNCPICGVFVKLA